MPVVSFGGHTFTFILPDPEGDIPISLLKKRTPNGMRVRCGLAKGSCYTPGLHPFDVRVLVLNGRGEFLLLDTTYPYEKGSEFAVPAHTAHSFIRVEDDTVFIKEINDLTLC